MFDLPKAWNRSEPDYTVVLAGILIVLGIMSILIAGAYGAQIGRKMQTDLTRQTATMVWKHFTVECELQEVVAIKVDDELASQYNLAFDSYDPSDDNGHNNTINAQDGYNEFFNLLGLSNPC